MIVAERQLAHLFKRCVQCPDTQPSCPSCPSGQVCSLVPQSCTACASTTCVKSAVGGSSSSGPNVGAIAGGVVGGVIFIAICTFLIWWFLIKPRRDAWVEDPWEEDDVAAQKHQSQFNAARDARASVHTVNSVATSFMSRASNIIPIAFIPGVTNRDGTPLDAPPVPPIPAARAPNTNTYNSNNHEGAIFFGANDIRDSSYSDTSTSDNRSTFFGRPSITPSLARSSMGDVYRDDALVNPMPAQTILRGRANMVSVNSRSPSGSGSPTEGTTGTATPIPLSDQRDFAQAQGISPSTSVRSAISAGKPKAVTVTKKKGRFPVRQVSDASTAPSTATATKPNVSSPLAATGYESSDDDEDDVHARARKSLLNPGRESAYQDSASAGQGPFGDDQQETGQRRGHHRDLSAVIEEATKRASLVPSHSGLGGKDDLSPFSDDHASE
ncbi:overproduction-induced pheromone-resistant [Zalaria obscura]|uniref:Overproduction-induced pheromone-resistant n=1 Tax=Zalaria obscura TaxID=2024903 RepID=A0ACC3SD69_9PEZI